MRSPHVTTVIAATPAAVYALAADPGEPVEVGDPVRLSDHANTRVRSTVMSRS